MMSSPRSIDVGSSCSDGDDDKMIRGSGRLRKPKTDQGQVAFAVEEEEKVYNGGNNAVMGRADHHHEQSQSSQQDDDCSDDDNFIMNNRAKRISRQSFQLNEANNQILIVDDNCFNIIALEELFSQNFNLNIDSANDGEQALKKVKQKYRVQGETYKLILMDFSMPLMDGPTSARQIQEYLSKEQEQNQTDLQRPLICCVSAYRGSQYRQKALEAGMDMFIDKNIDESKLKRVLIKAKMLEKE